jgi:hypothetical protein
MEKKRNHELADLLHEKTKHCGKVQSLYDKLKRKMMITPLQNAANQPLDQTLMHKIVFISSAELIID